MSGPENESPFATPEGADERIRAYEEVQRETKRALASDRVGIVAEPERGKRYKRLVLPESEKGEKRLGIGLTYFDEEHGGRVVHLTNGEYVEVDVRGIPVNPVLAQYWKEGKLPELVDVEPTIRGSKGSS